MANAERELAEDAEWKRIQQNTFTRWHCHFFIWIFFNAGKSVLPTNFNNFLLDQPKNSAAGEKVRPPHKIDSQRPILQFFNGSWSKTVRKN
jgi:hypothetical protein